MGESKNTLRILQDVLETTVSIHQATSAPNSKSYCDEPDVEEQQDEQSSTEEEPCSKMDPEETHNNADNLYVVDKSGRHVGSRPWLRYVMSW